MKSLTVMSANVLAGGRGRDGKDEDRFKRLLALLAQEKPDVLGVQEAYGWDRSGTYEQVCAALGMTGVVTDTGSDMRVAVFVREPLEIVGDPLQMTGGVWRHGAVRVLVKTPEGHEVTFGSAHMSVGSTEQRLLEAEQLIMFFNTGGRRKVCVMVDSNSADEDTDTYGLDDRGRAMLCYTASSVPDVRAVRRLVMDGGFVDLAKRPGSRSQMTTVGRYPALRPDRHFGSEAYAPLAGMVQVIDSDGTSDHHFLRHSLLLA